jgi:hypothetical protein
VSDVGIRVEYVVFRDIQIKSLAKSENPIFELSETQMLVVTEFKVLPQLHWHGDFLPVDDFDHLIFLLNDSNSVSQY